MRLASYLSLTVGIVLVLLKGVAWLVSDSLSMMSSLADSMLDVMASTINFLAVRYALQPPDEEHRFGHGKAEDLSVLAQSTFICGSGAFLIIEGIKRIFFPEEIHHSFIGIVIMLLSIVLVLGLVVYQRYVVSKTSSSAIASDAMHYFTDLISNVGVILALVLTTSLGWKSADPVIGIIIAVYLICSAIAMARESFQNLMDHEFSDAEREKIVAVVRSFPEVHGLHELRTRKSGINNFIQFHLDFINEDISLKHAHEISDNIEDALKEIFPHTEVLIHQDTLHGDKQPPKPL
jgi:ferrous-iron efflux pump FieF